MASAGFTVRKKTIKDSTIYNKRLPKMEASLFKMSIVYFESGYSDFPEDPKGRRLRKAN